MLLQAAHATCLQVMEHAPHIKKSWGLVLATVPWDQLGQRLYDTIFEARVRAFILLNPPRLY